MSDTPRYILFNSIGLAEKDLIGTAVVASIRQAYPEHRIVVVTNNLEIWLHNPHVYRVYKAGQTPYFYDEYVDGKDALIFWQDPYATDDFIQQKKHIIEIWCDLCGVLYKKTRPQLFFTQREQEVTKKILGFDKPTRPLFFIQTHSEAFPGVSYAWRRDIPTKVAEKIASEMHLRGYLVFHLRTGNEPVLSHAASPVLDMRQIFCALNLSNARLLINGAAQHAASALGKKSVVFWVAHEPTLIGYPLHVNIIPEKTTKLGQYVASWNESFMTHQDELVSPFPIEDYYSGEEIADILGRM